MTEPVKPRVLVFDVNETLLDLAPVKRTVGAVLGGREDLVPWWFSTMLHHSLVETVTGTFHDFGEIGTAALMMVAEAQGLELSREQARKAVEPILSLPPHDDVIPALETLVKGPFRLVSLTNSSSQGVETQFRNAGLTEFFERRYSIETIGKYKPHPDAYRMVLDDLDVPAEQALMVAAHGWDLAGAKSVGMQTAFIARPEKVLYPNVEEPDYIVENLFDLGMMLAFLA
ncbi:MAG: haloacid dehalogenase type II [Acidobacteriota bacterium]